MAKIVDTNQVAQAIKDNEGFYIQEGQEHLGVQRVPLTYIGLYQGNVIALFQDTDHPMRALYLQQNEEGNLVPHLSIRTFGEPVKTRTFGGIHNACMKIGVDVVKIRK